MRGMGQHHVRFTRALWERWLARLNAEPSKKLQRGIREMRALLQRRELRISARERAALYFREPE